MARRGVPEDVRPLVELAESYKEHPRGPFRIIPAGKHKKLADKDGKPMQDAEGKPIIISGSPGESRNRDQMTTRWLRAGVVPYDPWKPPQGKTGADDDNRSQEERERQARIAKRADESRGRDAKTQAIRSRLLPLLVRLGPFNDALVSELGIVLYHYARERQMPVAVMWETEGAAARTARVIQRGGTLAPVAADAWDEFTKDLEEAEKRPGGVVRRYGELQVQSTGKPSPVGRSIARARAAAERRYEGRERVEAGDALGPAPNLTLAVFYEMARGQDGSEESRERVFALARAVARLDTHNGGGLKDEQH